VLNGPGGKVTQQFAERLGALKSVAMEDAVDLFTFD
jgi:hypothetical protein